MDFVKIKRCGFCTAIAALAFSASCHAQYERTCVKRDFMDYYNNANYGEAKVPEYSLPDALTSLDGMHITTTEQWEKTRRPELMQLFTEFMYGRQPLPDKTFHAETTGTDKPLKRLRAMRRDIRLHLTDDGPDVILTLVWRKDKGHFKPRKTMLGLSFVSTDSILNVRFDGTPCKGAEAWQIGTLLDNDFAVALFHYTDAEGDKAKDNFKSSMLHRHFYRKGQDYPLPNEWGAVACWAWTASRALDAMEELAADVVKSDEVSVMGHSRLGKTALWAGATDKRFCAVVAVNSGCCGAALSRRCFGETLECVNEFSYHWFCGNFRQFSHRENYLPFDQHELVALIAPRKIIAISGTEDLWADPKGEELGCLMARPVYGLYGMEENLTYWLRKGPHAVLEEDWNFIIEQLK